MLEARRHQRSRLRKSAPTTDSSAAQEAVRLCRDADALAAAGQTQEAERSYRAALALDPRLAGAHNNLGNALRMLDRVAEAVECYRAALANGLDHPLVYYNLGSALRHLDRTEEAERAFRRALALQPDYAEAWNNRANLLRDLEWLEDSAVGYRRAVALRPDWEDAHDNLQGALYLLHEQGQAAAAERLARLWRRDHPDNPLARHIGAAIAGDDAEPRASDDYVRQTFDLFAAEFDSKLAELGYRAPALLAEALGRLGPAPDGTLAVLDAGCGTGLCAAALRPYAATLTGVDLSAGMLDLARDRKLYDRLEEAELGRFLAGHPAAFDLILAADVLCYFGVLDEVLAAAAAALRPGGLLAFTVERLGAEADAPYRIAPHGRYAHQETYVRGVLERAGLSVLQAGHDTLRQESGEPVAGLVVVAVRPV